MNEEDDSCESGVPIPIPINGELDLHSIPPREMSEVLEEYLRLCLEHSILKVRVIHGKGIGQLREIVHQALGKNPIVKEFHLAGTQFGGWGATIVHLRKP